MALYDALKTVWGDALTDRPASYGAHERVEFINLANGESTYWNGSAWSSGSAHRIDAGFLGGGDSVEMMSAALSAETPSTSTPVQGFDNATGYKRVTIDLDPVDSLTTDFVMVGYSTTANDETAIAAQLADYLTEYNKLGGSRDTANTMVNVRRITDKYPRLVLDAQAESIKTLLLKSNNAATRYRVTVNMIAY